MAQHDNNLTGATKGGEKSSDAPLVGRSLWADARRRLMHDKAAMLCLSVIIVYALVAIIAPFVYGDW
ncbi:MAG: hypothetical protein ACYSTL_00940, partial [Planctomycetota bacterium]